MTRTVFRTLLLIAFLATPLLALAGVNPADDDYSGRKGTTIYVSKLGDNSDGTSWKTAFHSIQKAIQSVPDDQGGHRIIIRPDHYVDPNLAPNQKGAPGSYNLLIGDIDGKFGSGAKGWVVIDAGDPEKGFKSWDWWSNIAASDKNWSRGNNKQNFSSIVWDRWALRNIYTSGGDAGLFWDLTHESGKGFTVLVEDCVGIGRAFGGGLCYPVVRPKEPSVFRRCYFLALDWVGDTAAVLLGGSEDTMPDHPHAVFEDCVIVHPDNAVAASYAAHCTRAKFKNCRLMSLNFTQPDFGQMTGLVYARGDHADKLHVDLEDCLLAGYMLFGSTDPKDVTYSTAGKVQAYVQFEQTVPKGFERLGLWPTDAFGLMGPPAPGGTKAYTKSAVVKTEKKVEPYSSLKKQVAAPSILKKLPGKVGEGDLMENTPILFGGKPYLIVCQRPATSKPALKDIYVRVLDLETGKEVSRFAQAHSFASAYIEGDTVHVFATKYTADDWTHDIYHFTSKDLLHWKQDEKPILARNGDEHLFNTSVCKTPDGYVMAYESNKPIGFCFKFAASKDLKTWKKLDIPPFTGENNEYSACPALRYFAPYFYVIYLHAAVEGHNGWISYVARSKDLKNWELSLANPILEACEGEGKNNSDVDLYEKDGKTVLFYATGDQATWVHVKRAVYDGPMGEMFGKWFSK